MGKKIKHFTASVYVVKNGKVFLHMHKKLNIWLPPGGHVEDGELPDEAAVREVKEETGLKIKLVGKKLKKFKNLRPLILPQFIQEEYVIDHYHIDLIYIGKPISGKLKDGRWFSLKELNNRNITPQIRHHAKTLLKKINIGRKR